MGQNNTFMLQLDTEQPTGEFLKYGAGYFDAVFFTQLLSFLSYFSDPPTGHATQPAGWRRRMRRYLCRRGHIGGLQALGSFRHFKLNAGSFIERPIPVRLDRAKMDEHIFSTLALYEAKSLGCIKPLYCAFFSHAASFSITANFLLALKSIHWRFSLRRVETAQSGLPDPVKPKTGGYRVYYSGVNGPLFRDTSVGGLPE